jgi:mannose-6-phosphate isomerase-like protein (cupin superfamily)
MKTTLLRIVTVASVLCPSALLAQSPKGATYITEEEIRKVNALPGTDHTLRVVDIGNENLAVGVIHRAAGSAMGGLAPATTPRGPAPQGEPCGVPGTAPPSGVTGISHDSQTEGYVIISGGGTLITGGHIVNGRKAPPDAEVTKVLNGPSCSGVIAGADVVKRAVKTGDVIIIPAGVPHGWSDITDHVDYLSIRPSDHVLEAGYVHPSLRK